jgi:hypothetical protein
MKVISILLALINSLTGGLLILSCISASESPGWVTLKTAAGILAICFGILTFKDGVQPVRPSRMLPGGLLLIIAGISVVAWGIHWSIVSGDVKNTVLLFGGSLFVQGLASIFGMAGNTFGA